MTCSKFDKYLFCFLLYTLGNQYIYFANNFLNDYDNRTNNRLSSLVENTKAKVSKKSKNSAK